MRERAQAATKPALGMNGAPVRGLLQRKCACGGGAGFSGECESCRKKQLMGSAGNGLLQRAGLPAHDAEPEAAPPIVYDVLRSPGQPLDAATRAFFEPRFGHDFSQVRVHTDARAAESARAVNALAYTVGHDVVFGDGRHSPHTSPGRRLLAHELTHVAEQGLLRGSNGSLRVGDPSSAAEARAEHYADDVLADRGVKPSPASGRQLQRRQAPYIKKVTVHLTPPQSADLEWEGTPPANASGSDNFTVSTGKGYGDPGDPPGTCTRDCCRDAMTQCAPPWNRPDRVGSCCTYYGSNFWTGTPLDEHNDWKWWTPIQPYYSSRGIALHQHREVTGQPIGHGCVRMEEPNAKRIYEFSNGRRTNVTIDGRAAPVICDAERRCSTSGSPSGSRGALEEPAREERLAAIQEAIPGFEGLMT